jgi:hypothetical protein
MTNTPLDAPDGFIPAEDERPAGQWMEAYWTEIATWAQRFAYVIWAYFAWNAYLQIKAYKAILILFDTPTLLLGFWCFSFGQNLSKALAGKNQILLEKGFKEFHRFLILALILAVFSIWTSIINWHTTQEIISTHSSPY